MEYYLYTGRFITNGSWFNVVFIQKKQLTKLSYSEVNRSKT